MRNIEVKSPLHDRAAMERGWLKLREAGTVEWNTLIDVLGLDRGLFVAVPYKTLLEGRV